MAHFATLIYFVFSDDDLEPYDMSNDVKVTKVKRPKYLRDCMEGKTLQLHVNLNSCKFYNIYQCTVRLIDNTYHGTDVLFLHTKHWTEISACPALIKKFYLAYVSRSFTSAEWQGKFVTLQDHTSVHDIIL